MAHPDLNLLITLDAVLTEGTVTGAARRLGLSESAMSRALARLREVTGDPLLVRAGRGLVPTPHAEALRTQVGPLVEQAEAVLRPVGKLNLARLERRFTLRSRGGFAESFGADLVGHVANSAPKVQLHFMVKSDKDNAPLRDGRVDLETGVITAETGPELRVQALFRDRMVVVTRRYHPLNDQPLTPEAYAAAEHVNVSRRGHTHSGVDAALAEVGLSRSVKAVVDGFSAALALVRHTNLVATLPDCHTMALRLGLKSRPVPVPVDDFTLSLMWHPRMDADPAHQWLRQCVRTVCAARAAPQR